MSAEPPGAGPWPRGVPPLVEARPLAGGFVGDTVRGRLLDGREVLVKRSPCPAQGEADGLRTLKAVGVPTPSVLGVAGGVLVLQYVAGSPDWAGLGRAVASLHRVGAARFGWRRDSCAGRFVQPNGWCDDWPTFFAERRVRAHLDDPVVPPDVAQRLHRACDGPLLRLLAHRPPPSLTHGDLWAGNVVDGRWLVDPEVSFADRELDLASMRGGGLPEEMLAAYEEQWPLDPGAKERLPALQLHHLLLQVRHFGVGQVPRIEAVLDGYGW